MDSDKTKGEKRSKKRFKDKHGMKVVGRSALLWERIKKDKAEKAKKKQEERKNENVKRQNK